MNNENYTVDWFISFFEAIPDDRWCLFDFLSPSGRSCALGHCGARAARTVIHTTDSKALYDLFRKEFKVSPERINDGCGISNFNQSKPRQRILAALRDIKAKQEAEQLNLQQCGVESSPGTGGHNAETRGGQFEDVRQHPKSTLRTEVGKQPEFRPATAALPPPPVREPVGCVHMWLETTQTCLYCCASKPVEQRVTAQL